MNDSLINYLRLPGRIIVYSMILLMFTSFPVHAQQDFDRLYEDGKRAFDRSDYITAYAKLIAYWHIMRYEAQRAGFSADNRFYNEVINAAQYSEDRINEMIQRMRTLEQNERVLSQDLAACTKMCSAEKVGSRGIMSLPSTPPPTPPLTPPPRPTLRSQVPGR